MVNGMGIGQKVLYFRESLHEEPTLTYVYLPIAEFVLFAANDLDPLLDPRPLFCYRNSKQKASCSKKTSQSSLTRK